MHRIAIVSALFLLAGCGGGGRPTGPPAPVGDTLRTITGTVAYFTTGPLLSNFDANGRLIPQKGFVNANIPRAAAHIPVEIYAPDGTLMAADVTDPNGQYSIEVNFGLGAEATGVSVRAVAQLNLPFGTRVRVFSGPSANQPYSRQTPLMGDPTQRVMNIDVTIGLNENAAAFHMLQTLWDGFIAAKSGISTTMFDLDVHWAPGNGDQSLFEAFPSGGRLTVAGGITGDLASNEDAWSHSKVQRLFGEYLLAYYFHEAAPEGTITDAKLVPSAAWREGFLDFWACMGRGSRIYWDTEGLGSEGRVTRYFDIESYFDASLGSLGPDDPNVYQDSRIVGLGSAFSVAEILWDIHDRDQPNINDVDGIDEFPLFLTLQFLRVPRPGFSYPYLYTLLDTYVDDGSLSSVRLDNLMVFPENQGMRYPATPQNELVWPIAIGPGLANNGPINPPLDKTISDRLDTQTPTDPINVELGFHSQRYYLIDVVRDFNVTVTLSNTTGDLEVDILDLNNVLLATGVGSATATGLPAKSYIIRVRSVTNPQIADYDMRVEVVESNP